MKSKTTKVIVEGKILYIKNFRVIHPIRNEDGSINWFNLLTGGSWKNIMVIGIVVGIITGVFWEYSKNINMFLNCFSDMIQLEACKQSFGTNLTNIIIP